MQIGQNLTKTCHDSYLMTNIKLQAPTVNINNRKELGYALSFGKDVHEFHSNTIESYLMFHRITHDCLYRDYGLHILNRMKSRFEKNFQKKPDQDFPVASVPQLDLYNITNESYDHFKPRNQQYTAGKKDRLNAEMGEVKQASFALAETLKV